MPMLTLFTIYVLSSSLVNSVHAASNGVKGSACVNLFPGHAAPEQNGVPPYRLSFSSPYYNCGSNITITLTSNDVQGFKGFLCQTRTDLQEYVTFGTLSSDGVVPVTNKCDQTGSASHSNPEIKSSVTFLWSPPSIDVGEIYVICTVVKEFEMFWTNVVSSKITYSTSCPVSTISPSTSSRTSTPTVTSSSIHSSLSSDISNITISSSTSLTNGTTTHVPSTTIDFTNSSKSNSDNSFFALCIVLILYAVSCI